jgi:hypothetical protein
MGGGAPDQAARTESAVGETADAGRDDRLGHADDPDAGRRQMARR